MATPLGIALVGTRFMGRAHSNAWSQCGRFFELPRAVRLGAVAGRNARHTASFARRWGWVGASTDWRDLVEDPSIELVDVATPNHLHAEISIAALKAGKHVACEKPLAGTIEDARRMRDAAAKASRRGVRTFVWFNYRRCPAVALAHQLVREGRLGAIHHVRAHYLQDWGRASTPLGWRFKRAEAGSGAHGDLNAHIVDMARFVTGDEISEVVGAIEETFITRREIPMEVGSEIAGTAARARSGAGGGRGRGAGAGGARRAPSRRFGRSEVDDCVLFLARFAGGAVASFESTRLATGNQNRNEIEINGDRGSVRFDFERMNELLWWDDALPSKLRGWSRIMCTNAGDHPYASAYWPAAHLIGYEHGFVSMAADIVRALGGGKPEVPLPDFEDAWRTQQVLEAALRSARTRRPVAIESVR
ncbi:MAG: Gfo/Idh/MocA family oxidoreductase [Phycisphaerae bacterium]|nr:Gfo/Idh/MocA family oxidoreductase [Phycisphaerae bacterium]